MTPKKGFRFKHARLFDSTLSLAEMKAMPRERAAQLCEVTAVRRGLVYYRPVYDHGERETLGGCIYSTVEKFPRVILGDVEQQIIRDEILKEGSR